MRISLFLQAACYIQSIYGLNTIWESFEMSDSKTLYAILSDSKYQTIQNTLNDTKVNQTFFLPSELAMQSAIKNNLFSNNTNEDRILYTILPNVYSTSSFGEKRQYLNTMSTTYPVIITTPTSTSQNTFNFQILSGPIIANVINYTQCINGVIYTVDDFLLAPLNPLDTISAIPELENLENMIKSQNLSDIIDVPNSTIFAPVNTAWSSSTKHAYGAMVHSLEYQTINQVYYQQDLFSKNLTLITEYLSNTIQTESYTNQTIVIIGGNSVNSDGSMDVRAVTVATVIRSDILTSSGTVIHLIDKILPADATVSERSIVHKLKAGTQMSLGSVTFTSSPLYIFLFIILIFVI